MRLTRVLYVLAQFRVRPRQIGPSHIHQITQTAYYATISAMERRLRIRVVVISSGYGRETRRPAIGYGQRPENSQRADGWAEGEGKEGV